MSVSFKIYSDTTVATPVGYTERFVSAVVAAGGNGTTSSVAGADPNRAFALTNMVTDVLAASTLKIYRFMDDGNYSGDITNAGSAIPGGSAGRHSILVGWPNQNGANAHSNGRAVIIGRIAMGTWWVAENLSCQPSLTTVVPLTLGTNNKAISCEAISGGTTVTCINSSSSELILGCRISGGSVGINNTVTGLVALCTIEGAVIAYQSSNVAIVGCVLKSPASGNTVGIVYSGNGGHAFFNTIHAYRLHSISLISGSSTSRIDAYGNIISNPGGAASHGVYNVTNTFNTMNAVNWVYNPSAIPLTVGAGVFSLRSLGSTDPTFINIANMDFSMAIGSLLRNHELLTLVAKQPFWDLGGYQHVEPAGGGGEGATGTLISRGINR